VNILNGFQSSYLAGLGDNQDSPLLK